MKHVFPVVCLAGIVLVAGCFGWWLLNRGELLAELHLLRHQQSGKANGPYRLTPAHNPVRLRVSVSGPLSGGRDLFGEARVCARMLNSSGEEVWAGTCQIGQTPQPGQDTKLSTFGPVIIEQADKYTFRCTLEKLPEDWTDAQRGEFGVVLSIRKNAQPFPVVPALVGFGLIVAGAAALHLFWPDAEPDIMPPARETKQPTEPREP